MRAEKLNYMIPLGGGGREARMCFHKTRDRRNDKTSEGHVQVTTYQTQCETAMKKSGKTERSGALIIC